MVSKLSSSIKEFHIEGNTDDLAHELTNTCQIMIGLTEQVSQFRRILIIYSDSNNSPQYQKACNASDDFLTSLNAQLEELTDLQKAAIQFIDKINEFNDEPPCGVTPLEFDKQSIDIQISNSKVSMTREDIEVVLDAIKNLVNMAVDSCISIKAHTSEMSSIWKDEQYDAFDDFINEIVDSIKKSVMDLEDYYVYLQNKLNVL